jgi:dimethylhistidine N-methyltransferase
MTLRHVASSRFSARQSDFAEDVTYGLSRPRKSIRPRYFYDARGSELFDEITDLPEYYLTRAEIAILNSHSQDICDGASCTDALVELGSGSSRKTEILLEAMPQLKAYIPIDVSRDALDGAQRRLASRFPRLTIRPVVADFLDPTCYPTDLAQSSRIGFFPGSTIGNLMPIEAARLLTVLRNAFGQGSRLIVGVDLKKDAHRLIAAYNDSKGVTAAFNLNLLARMNRELCGNFDSGAFRHRAIYNAQEGRIEMHIISLRHQTVEVLGKQIRFRAGESIHTENSYKYSPEQFQTLAGAAGWSARQVWFDQDRLFSVHELVMHS